MATSRPKPRSGASRPPEAILRATKEPDFRQERSRRSYLGLIEAASDLFSKHGYDSVGTPEIAQKAGVSVGTFYRYFEDKHEVYIEIARRSMVSAYAETIEGLTPARFVGLARRETIEHTISLLFDHVLVRPHLSRSFSEMSLRDPEVAELRRAFETVSVRKLTELIATIVPRDVVPDPEATAWVLYGSAMQCAYGLAEHVGPAPVGSDRAKKALTDFIERALFPR
ncbi:MAG: TetR/AcrR family transcriptional regulator [Deltaproteobacteria bacterium]|nr:TetR/AcrR family transcriptional regulator [Deltaproteobacteria bacterium]